MPKDLLPAPLAPELSPEIGRAPDRHPAAVYLARLAPGSRRTLLGALDTMAALLTGGRADAMACPWHLLRYPHTQAVRAALAERYAPATVNKHLAALRGVLKEAWRLGLIDGESYQRTVDLAGVRGTALPAGRGLTSAELRALFEACADGTPGGARDAALLALLYGALLRRSEAVALDLADYDPDSGALKVRGKGNKERVSYLPAGGRAAVDAWLRVRGDELGPLLVPVRGAWSCSGGCLRRPCCTPARSASAWRRGLGRSARMTCGAPPSVICSTPASIWPRCSTSPGTPRCRRRRGMIGGPRR